MSECRVSEIVGVLRQVRDHWHEQGLYGDVEMGAAAELIEQQQAAIQRVRQVAERFASGSGPDPYGFGVARAVAADAVLDALDGDG